jgi:hypothetical protein
VRDDDGCEAERPHRSGRRADGQRDAAGALDQYDQAITADPAIIVVASWSYLGSGYQTTGEAWLAASAAARAREERRIAKEELRTMTIGVAEQE